MGACAQAAQAEISALQSAYDSLKVTLANMHTAHAAAEREVGILEEAKTHRVSGRMWRISKQCRVAACSTLCLGISDLHLALSLGAPSQSVPFWQADTLSASAAETPACNVGRVGMLVSRSRSCRGS